MEWKLTQNFHIQRLYAKFLLNFNDDKQHVDVISSNIKISESILRVYGPTDMLLHDQKFKEFFC